MWYFSWMLGLGLAVACGIINVMWLESNFAFGLRKEEETEARFRNISKSGKAPLIIPTAVSAIILVEVA